jgi:hypothetical protein
MAGKLNGLVYVSAGEGSASAVDDLGMGIDVVGQAQHAHQAPEGPKGNGIGAKSHSGSDAAKEEQHRIIVLLLEHGASPNDFDAKDKTVAAAALSDWIRQLRDSY